MAPRRTSRTTRVVLLGTIVGGLVLAGLALAGVWRPPAPIVERCDAEVGERTARLTLTQAEHASLIVAVAVQRGMPARAGTIALTTAFQESDLYNLDYGDRDSLGLFQQRPSQGWGSGEEIMDPYFATHAFYDALADVPGYTEIDIGAAAQAVQTSAFPDAYAQHEPAARALASSLGGHSPGALSCTIDPDRAAAAAPGDLAAELGRAFGTDEVSEPAAGGSLEAPAPTRTYGWAVAHWTVTYASRFGVAEVAFDGRRWRAEDSGRGWREDRRAPGDHVRVAFAP